MSSDGSLSSIFKKYIISGVLVIVPLIITYVVLRFFLSAIDGILSPLLIRYIGYDIPGLGIAIMVLLIILTGILTRGVLGREVVNLWDKLLFRLPIVRSIYIASKQLIQSLTDPRGGMFQRVVIIPYPREGSFTLAFAGTEFRIDAIPDSGELVPVFVPSTPTPFTGFTLLVKKEEVYPTNISVEDAVKFIVSGGIVMPEQFVKRLPGGIQTA